MLKSSKELICVVRSGKAQIVDIQNGKHFADPLHVWNISDNWLDNAM